jgi:hypothetical protein
VEPDVARGRRAGGLRHAHGRETRLEALNALGHLPQHLAATAGESALTDEMSGSP